MRALLATELLDIWEHGYSRPLTAKALALLVAACPELSYDELADLPIGRRDGLLLQLRERLFGSSLAVVASCPQCDAALESSLQISDLHPDSVTEQLECTMQIDGCELVFRLLTSRDLLTLRADEDAASARGALLSRCVIEGRSADGQQLSEVSLLESLGSAIAAEMAAADPQAERELALVCPSCEHSWRALFDIVDFLWKEIHAWAQRLLRDVHGLARAYGWREAEVLALSPARRQIYLQLCYQ